MKIVITGMSLLSSAGNADELWDAVVSLKDCLSEHERPDDANFPVKVVGKIKNLPKDSFHKKVKPYLSRHALLGAACIQECIDNLGKDELQNGRTGFLFGSASYGQDQVEKSYRSLWEQPFYEIDSKNLNTISNAGACNVLASHFGISGYVHAVEGASCSGMISVATGYNLIKSGVCDRVFCVIGEANLFPATYLFYNRKVRAAGLTYTFFGKMKGSEMRNTNDYIIPFSNPDISDRGAIAEAGACVVLESDSFAANRKAKIFGEIEDYSYHFHADNLHGSDLDLKGLKTVLNQYKGHSFDSIHMPVTGCYPLDLGPISVCSELFSGSHAFTAEPVIGHTGASTSLINIILALKSLEQNTLLPSKNYDEKKKDIYCRLSPANRAVSKNLDKILVLSSGWGGYNGACMVKKWHA